MSEFTFRSDSIDVEQVMEQIRARIREKRGTDYTQAQIRDLANVTLERFLDPKSVRSDLLQHARRRQAEPNDGASEPEPDPVPRSFVFDPDTIYRSSRGWAGRLLQRLRRIGNPLLKIFFNPTPIAHALSLQQEINDRQRTINNRQGAVNARREHREALTYEMLHNLVVGLTRLSIAARNDQMRVASLASRLDFAERRSRALERVVAYRQDLERAPGGVPAQRKRRRARRRQNTRPPES